MSYTLYFAPGAASMLPHLVLLETGAPHRLEKVDTAAGAQRSPEYLKLNPAGVVPTLVVDGKPMAESAAIALLLAERHPDAKLVPAADDPARATFLQWTFALANTLQPNFRLWWYPAEGAGEANVDATKATVRARIEKFWDRLDAHLAANGPCVCGERFTLGAAGCAPFHVMGSTSCAFPFTPKSVPVSTVCGAVRTSGGRARKSSHGLAAGPKGSAGPPSRPPDIVWISPEGACCANGICAADGAAPGPRSRVDPPYPSPWRNTVPCSSPSIETTMVPASAAWLSGIRPRHTTNTSPRSVSIPSVSARSDTPSPARPGM